MIWNLKRVSSAMSTLLPTESGGPVRDSKIAPSTSAFDQKRTLKHLPSMSALAPKAAIRQRGVHVRYLPISRLINRKKIRYRNARLEVLESAFDDRIDRATARTDFHVCRGGRKPAVTPIDCGTSMRQPSTRPRR